MRQPSPDNTTILEWRVHLLSRQPKKIILVAAVIGWAVVLTLLSWGSWLYAVFCGLLLVSAISEYWLPISYRITERGVYSRNFLSLRHLPWAQVRKCYQDGHGIKLSPLPRRSRLETFRGIYLWFADNKDQVIAAVEQGREQAGVEP